MSSRRDGLRSYVIRRSLQAIPLLFAVVLVNFFLIQLAPGDPILALTGDFPTPPGYADALREAFGLDKPLYEQLYRYVTRVVQGDFGYSFRYRQPVFDLVLERVPATVLLTGTALLMGLIVGVASGVIAGQLRNTWVDSVITSLAIIGFSLPVFWLGQVMLIIFALNLDAFPAAGMRSIRQQYESSRAVLDVGWHLTLPALALATRQIATNCRIARASVLEVLKRDFVTAAHAKGLPQYVVMTQHVLRNALLPVVTIVGYNMGFLLAGSALVETVFGWPGIGRLVFEAVYTRDYPVIIGVFTFVTATIVTVNLITDVAYAYLDPRIRY